MSNKENATPSKEQIQKITKDFYDRVFTDPMIGHFFYNKDKERLINSQISLTKVLFSGSIPEGLPQKMKQIHHALNINGSQFDRRQMILKETLLDQGTSPEQIEAWLAAEKSIKPWIIRHQNCRH